MGIAVRISRFFYLASAVLAVLLVSVLLLSGLYKGNGGLQGDRLDMRHSVLLDIVDCDGYSAVELRNPWGEGILQRYLLVPKDSILPALLPEGVVVRTPVERALLFSGVHISLFEELGASAAVAAVCDAEYIYSEMVLQGVSNGDIIDCGSSLDVNMEQVAAAMPDAIFVLPFENGGYGKLERVSVPLIECADYMEVSPLACAEWIRFYGRLVGRAAVADSIYDAVCNEYEALRLLAAREYPRPRLLCELKSSSAWYLPAGGSTMGRMYADAGADYIFSYCEGSGSVPLSYETVLDKAADADIWLLKYNSEVDKSLSSLLAEFEGYSHFRPFKEKNVFACNAKHKRLFEDRAFHPEKMLKELVALFHPNLLSDYKLRYYEKMR